MVKTYQRKPRERTTMFLDAVSKKLISNDAGRLKVKDGKKYLNTSTT